ncbi:MAG: fibronectin type III domain-containing protein [Lachnospiraceae bacterium]|nr:fibronectin type III domain-containing protein [Lachnospiraceae bacterium]
MKKFKVSLIAVIMIMAVALTSCGKIEGTGKINKDGSGSFNYTVSISSEVIKKYIEKEVGFTIPDYLYPEVEEKFLAESKMEKVVKDGKIWYVIEEKQNNISNLEYNNMLCSDGEGYVTGDVLYMCIDPTHKKFIKEQMKDADLVVTDSDAKKIKETYTFEFEEPIVKTTGTIDPNNPNKVTFNVDKSKSKYVIFATTKNGVTVESVKATIKKFNNVNKSSIKNIKADKVKKKSKKASVTYKLKKVFCVGYQIQYSKKKNMKGGKTITVSKPTGKIKNLKKGTKYYVRVRAYKYNYAGNTIYSGWSKVKAVKTKK